VLYSGASASPSESRLGGSCLVLTEWANVPQHHRAPTSKLERRNVSRPGSEHNGVAAPVQLNQGVTRITSFRVCPSHDELCRAAALSESALSHPVQARLCHHRLSPPYPPLRSLPPAPWLLLWFLKIEAITSTPGRWLPRNRTAVNSELNKSSRKLQPPPSALDHRTESFGTRAARRRQPRVRFFVSLKKKKK